MVEFATTGPDGRRIGQLLRNAKDEAGRVLHDVSSAAARRWDGEGDLFSEEERRKLERAFAEAIAPSALLGMTRIAKRLETKQKFAEATDLSAFAEPLGPMTVVSAIERFKRSSPLLRLDPKRFELKVRENAHEVVKLAEEVLRERIDAAVGRAIDTGAGIPRGRALERLLEDVGVGVKPNERSYAETVVRTNIMEAYRAGAQAELNELADDFPGWTYHAVVSKTSRPHHAARDQKRYPSSVEFADVRGRDVDEVVNCRCDFTPVYKTEWRRLEGPHGE